MIFLILACPELVEGPHRLTVRTSAFQAGNRGSIPRGVTICVKRQTALPLYANCEAVAMFYEHGRVKPRGGGRDRDGGSRREL